MKYQISSLLLLIAISTTTFAGEKIDKTLAVQPNGSVEIIVVKTDVEVKVWDKAEVRVVGELDDAAERFIFETSGSETTIEIEIDDGHFGRHWSMDSDSHLTIHIPSNSSLHAGGVSSDFSVTGVKGGTEVESVSGDIDIIGSIERIEIESVSGDINIKDSSGKMDISSVSGDITTNGKALHFTAQTVSGDIEASIGISEQLDLTTVSGDIEIDFVLAEDGHIEADTVSGDVTLNFANDVVNARFDIDTGPGGDIDNNITDDKPDSSFIGSEEIKFTSGNGNGTVDINTMSGNIDLEK